jgi:hypothetical protein
MNFANAAKLHRKSGGSPPKLLPYRPERCDGPAAHPRGRKSRITCGRSVHPSVTAAEVSAALPLCHPERTPDFLLRCSQKRPRMRLSLKKAACGSRKPLSLTGNPEEAEGSAVLFPHPRPLLEVICDRRVAQWRDLRFLFRLSRKL